MMKVLATIVLVGACYALPVEESIPLEGSPASQPVALELTPVKGEDAPEPSTADSSDLKTDANTWWHSWYHYNFPVYYHNTPRYYWRSSW